MSENSFKLSSNQQRELDDYEGIKRGHPFLIVFILFIIFCLSLFFFGKNKYEDHLKSNLIQEGVTIRNIDVSGLTKEEALNKVKTNFDEKLNDNITLTYNNSYYDVTIEQIDAKFNIEDCVDFAYKIGRSGNFFEDLKNFLYVYYCHTNIDPEVSFNEEALYKYLDIIEAHLPDQLEESDYYVEDDELIIVNGKVGAGIFKDELKETILEAIQDMSYRNTYIAIPTYFKYPNPIDVYAIHDDIYRGVENAYFTTEPMAVYPEVVGVDFNVDKILAEIEADPHKEEYTIALDYTQPEVTTDDIGREAFPDLLGKYATNYYASNKDRTTNLRLAASKINGKVIMPGEVFSYNRVVGKRTIAAGYKNAPIYSKGQVVDGLGGGICQVSSTLYNAALLSDMTIVSRTNHMFVPSYVKGGRDATVVWGSIDFKFRNDRNYPIKIEASVSDGVCYVAFYGLKNENELEIQIQTDVIRTIKFNTIREKRAGYSSGDVIQGGQNGSVVDSYRLYYQNGNLIEREKLSRDTYDAEARIIAK